jgi:hypothetical protein
MMMSAAMMLVCLIGWSLVCGCLHNTSCAGDLSLSAIDYIVLPVFWRFVNAVGCVCSPLCLM